MSDTEACDSQEAASCSNKDIAGHAASQSAPPEPRPSQFPLSNQLHCEVKEAKSSLSQSEERASNKQGNYYPWQFDALGKKEPDKRQNILSSKNASNLSKEILEKDLEASEVGCINKNIDQPGDNNNLTKNSDANISKNDSRDDSGSTTVPLKTPPIHNELVLKIAKRHVYFARKRVERSLGKESSKPKEGYHSGICSSGVRMCGGGLRAGTVILKTQHIQGKAILKRAKSYVPVDLEESSKQEEGNDGHRSTSGQGPSTGDGLSNAETRSIPSVEASPSKKEAPLNQVESTPDTSDPEASIPGAVVGSRTLVHNAVPEVGISVVKGFEFSHSIQKNRHESKVFMYIRYF